MKGHPTEKNTIRKPVVDVTVEGKTYSVYEQGNGVYGILTTSGRSLINEPGESKEDFVERALRMGVDLKEAK